MSAPRTLILAAGAVALILALVALILVHERTQAWNAPLMVLILVAVIVLGLSLRREDA